MSKINAPIHALNAGEISRLALARVDMERMRLAAETQKNWMPRVLGPMSLRPGLKYLGSTRNDLQAWFIPFVFGNSDTAALELTSLKMRVWVDDVAVTRPRVGTVVTNGTFSAAAGWIRSPAIGALATATISGGKLTLNAQARGGKASCGRWVAVPRGARGVTHGLRITVDRGPVTFRVGTTALNDALLNSTELAEGTHSLAITPNANTAQFFIHFESHALVDRIVDEVRVETSADLDGDDTPTSANRILMIPAPWTAADLPYLRFAQSGDVIFVACRDVHPYKIERRGSASWSIVKYLPDNGPLQTFASEDVRLTPGACFGNTTLTADIPFFKAEHVGSIFRLFTTGQRNEIRLAGEDTWCDPVRIVGVTKDLNNENTNERNFSFKALGVTWKGKLTIQRSFDEGDLGIGFQTVEDSDNDKKKTDTEDSRPQTRYLIKDKFDNRIVWYRIGFLDGGYQNGSGAVTIFAMDGKHAALEMTDGGRVGYCRVTGYTSPTTVSIEVLKEFSSLQGTKDWIQGAWSDIDGYPSSVAFHDGRLWWAGGDKIWGSVSDDYDNFDIDKEGDAGPILRNVGYGPIDSVNWMLPLSRLIMGREGSETSIRSSSIDEPITPTSFTLKDCSTKGSARIAAIKCDTQGLFVSKSGKKLYELVYDGGANDYQAHDLTRLNPDISGEGGFKRLALQTHPDTAVHCVRDDGQVAVLLYDKEDEVVAWWRVDTDGSVEDAFVLPGEEEDSVYYVVKRTINGSTKRYLEKFALRSECTGLPDAKLADSFIIDTGGDRAISALNHLEGELVVAWGWNDDDTSGTYIVNPDRSDGRWLVENNRVMFKPGTFYDNVCIGLRYQADFKSAKLAYAAEQGTALTQKKRVDHVGLIMFDTHYQGVQVGQDEDHLDDLHPTSETTGTDIPADTVHSEFDETPISLNGSWSADSRLFLRATAPKPATVAGVVVSMQTNG